MTKPKRAQGGSYLIKKTGKAKAKNYYIDNKKLYTALIEYKNSIKEAERLGQPKPRIPDYIGKCIFDIATKLSSSYSFAHYTFREDMIMDGVETCVRYIDNFDPERYNNPLAYLTQISYFAFISRINSEKKYLVAKQKSLENTVIFGDIDELVHSDDISNEYMNTLVKNFDEKAKAKKRKKKQSKNSIDMFYGDSEDDE